ncbi:Com family DNA-binding transcriptional regulator [Variovorax sp. E3]|uniref:Com family DNA-binding transcriptional regulator n=1 Tax=Variovorax sp. E3 TaxID=1914993 RepID=UPI0018DBFA85|nr:Com family DNA-binding transcriptional regulator [Variovorax sp. E3]
MDDVRCGACNRKLATGEYRRLQIKCPRCGAFNDLRAVSPTIERPRASNPERTPDAQIPSQTRLKAPSKGR